MTLLPDDWPHPPNRNYIYIGGSGRGKNTGLHEDLLREAGQNAIHYADPRGDNTLPFLKKLWNRYSRIIVDDLTQNEHVLPVQTILVGATEAENEDLRDQALDVLNSFVDTGLEDAPIKRHYCSEAIRFFQNLPPAERAGLPAAALAHLFKPNTKLNRWLLSHCPSEELWHTFSRLRTLHESPRLQTVGAAERLITQAWGSAAIRARDVGHGLDWKRIIEERWIVITKGGPGASPSAVRAIIRSRNIEALRFLARTHICVR